GVAVVGDEADLLVRGAVVGWDGELVGQILQLIPCAGGLFGVDAGFAKDSLIPVKSAVIRGGGDGEDLPIIGGLRPAGLVVVLLADGVGVLGVAVDVVVEWDEGVAAGPVAD